MKEYIDREAAIAALNKVRDDQRVFKYATASDFLSARDAIERAIKVLESLPAADVDPVQEWISVYDELPENDQLALCFMKDKSFGTFRVFQWNYIDWQWNDGNEWFDEKDVTHWMPVPHPPKGGNMQ